MKGDKEMFEIMKGMDDVNMKMAKEIEDSAPICHFRKMFVDESDTTDGYSETWWECSVCGHTKDFNFEQPKEQE